MFCKQCRYNLKANDSNACPECDQTFDRDNPDSFAKYPIPGWRVAILRFFTLLDHWWTYALSGLVFIAIAMTSDSMWMRTEFAALACLELYCLIGILRRGPRFRGILERLERGEDI